MDVFKDIDTLLEEKPNFMGFQEYFTRTQLESLLNSFKKLLGDLEKSKKQGDPKDWVGDMILRVKENINSIESVLSQFESGKDEKTEEIPEEKPKEKTEEELLADQKKLMAELEAREKKRDELLKKLKE